jgi:hypothetical protein
MLAISDFVRKWGWLMLGLLAVGGGALRLALRQTAFRLRFDAAWLRLPVIGRFFSGRFVLGVDDTDYLIEVSKGKIQKIAEGLAPNDFGFEFALRASSVTWGKSLRLHPRPTAPRGPCRSRCRSSSPTASSPPNSAPPSIS